MTSVDPIKFDNFFVLFEQSVQFDISQAQLDQRLRELQKRYHPDNTNNTLLEQDIETTLYSSEQTSALVNQAYQTLSGPDSRATYLLELSDQAQSLDKSIADLDFLNDAMQLRIDLEESIEDKSRSELELLHPQISKRLNDQSQSFTDAYQNKDWPTAIDATQKLKFLVKLNADIIIALDELIGNEQDDDDLYV